MSDGILFAGNSKLFDGPLGVVKIAFNGYDLGKTTEDSNLTPEQDIKDIIFQQDGTKAADHTRTGIEYMLSATFGEIRTGLLRLMMSGIESKNENSATDYGVLGRDIYQSMRAKEAGPLKVAAVDSYGIASKNDEDIFMFYEAIPLIEGELVNWGADSQRNLPVNFRIKFHTFPTTKSYSVKGAFGYWGDPIDNDVLPIVWPNVAGPKIATAIVSNATTLVVTFDKNVAFQGRNFVVGTIMVEVNGIMILATRATIVNKVLTITFPNNSFVKDAIVELTISDKALQDTETTPNKSPGVAGYIVNNPLA